MANAQSLRTQADRKRYAAQAIEERDRAKSLRAQAETAEKNASDLESKSEDPVEQFFGVVGVIMFLAAVGYFFFG